MEHSQKVILIKASIDKMPSLPTTVTKILEICNNPKTSPADLNKVISLDPVLMGKVMKLINSAYYGLSQEVTSLVRAIIMLGINTVKNLALSTAVLGTLGKANQFQALNMEGFWRHSLCVGVTAKLIAKKRKIDPRLFEEYFIAGLLHDIGKIPLNNKLSRVRDSHELRTGSPSPLRVRKSALGIHHSEVGK
jgi:HD-like signal output (HDOD) protein